MFYKKCYKKGRIGKQIQVSIFCKAIGIFVIVVLTASIILSNSFQRKNTSNAFIYNLPLPGKILPLSKNYSFPLLKGIKFDPSNPLNLEFVIDTADKKDVSEEEVTLLIRYFLAGLTLPEQELWVNLSPYEEDKVVPENLGLTDLGKDMLGQDYVLKQLLSSLTYPESKTGRDYWKELYEKVAMIAGTTNIAIDTFNKVWVMPDEIIIYENGNGAFITRATLKTMLENDYFVLKNKLRYSEDVMQTNVVQYPQKKEEIDTVVLRVMKELVIPKVNEDVNYGENFSRLRQIYHSLILSVWFKQRFQESFFKHYINKEKIKGIDLVDKDAKDRIYKLYVEAYKKGVYNYIKKDCDPVSHKYLNRKYYSGGIVLNMSLGSMDNLSSSAVTIKIIGPEELSIADIEHESLGKLKLARVGVDPKGKDYDLGAEFGGELYFMDKLLECARSFYQHVGSKNPAFISPRNLIRFFLKVYSSEELSEEKIKEVITELGQNSHPFPACKVTVRLIDLSEDDSWARQLKKEVVDKDKGIRAINYQNPDGSWTVVMLKEDFGQYEFSRGRPGLGHELVEISFRQQNYHWIDAHNMACDVLDTPEQKISKETADKYKTTGQGEVGAAFEDKKALQERRIKEALVDMEGIVDAVKIAEAAGLTKSVVWAHDVKRCIDEENSRRRENEPQRRIIALSGDLEEFIKDGLQRIDGRVNLPGLSTTIGVTSATLSKYDYRSLIESENQRRLKEEQGRPLIELAQSPTRDTEAEIRTVLTEFDGEVTQKEILQAAGVKPKKKIDYQRLIEEENVRRNREEPEREPMQLFMPGTAKSKLLSRVSNVLRTMDGVVTQKAIASALGYQSHQPLVGFDYHSLVDEENIRRRNEEPGRSLLEFPPDKPQDTVQALKDELKKIDGFITQMELARRIGVVTETLAHHGWRSLIDEENERRHQEEPERNLVTTTKEASRDVSSRIQSGLKQLEGRVDLNIMAKAADLSKGAINRMDYRQFVKAENARRQEEEPNRPLIFYRGEIDDVLAVKLRNIAGRVTAENLAVELGSSKTAIQKSKIVELIEQENTRRLREEPQRPLLQWRAVTQNPDQVIEDYLKKWEGSISVAGFARAANLSTMTVHARNFYALVEKENARRQKEEPQRSLITFAQRRTTKDPLPLIREALQKAEGRVTAESIAVEIKISYVTVYNYDYRNLVEEENQRRQKEEPERLLLEVPKSTLERLQESLRVMEGQIMRKDLIEESGVSREVIKRYGFAELVMQENERRLVEEPNRELLVAVFRNNVQYPDIHWHDKLDELELGDAVALLAADPLRLKQYLTIFHPELLPQDADSIVVTAMAGLHADWQQQDNLHDGYQEELNTISLDPVIGTTDTVSIVFFGTAEPGVTYIQVRGAYTRKIKVRNDGNFRGVIPLPKIGETNYFYLYAVNEQNKTIGPSVNIAVQQTGEKKSDDQVFLELISLKKDLLETILKNPARYLFLLRSLEMTLLKYFTYNEQEGLEYIRKRINDEQSPEKKALLYEVYQKFSNIVKMDIGDKLKSGQRLYFFQKYCLYEIQRLKEQGEPGIILANEQGLGKTITALAAVNGNPTVIIAPNSVVTTWVEQEEQFIRQPQLRALEGAYSERERNLMSLDRPQVVTNIEFARGMTDTRRDLLSRPDGVLVVDEADYMGSPNSQQAEGTRQLQAKFKILLTATPFSRPSQIIHLLHFLRPDDTRFTSAVAFFRAFPADSPEALNALYLLLYQHSIRIRKKDVFEEYDEGISLDKQADHLPKKIEINPEEKGAFYLTAEQCDSILELFTEYQEWCNKHIGLESTEDTQYYRYPEGYFSKKEALRQIMNDPAYIGYPDIESPKHREVVAIVDSELGDNANHKGIIFCRYRAQVQKYLEMFKHYGARSYYGGLRQNRDGYKVDEDGNLLYYEVDDYDNYRIHDGKLILSNRDYGRPIKALDYERISFQNDPQSRLIIATYDAGAVGVNFTAADFIISDDLASTYRDQYQSDDRAHRIDNVRRKYNVRYYRLQARYPDSFIEKVAEDEGQEFADVYFGMGTLDQVQSQNLNRQSRLFHRILDGVGDFTELDSLNSQFMKDNMPFLFINGNNSSAKDELSDFPDEIPEQNPASSSLTTDELGVVVSLSENSHRDTLGGIDFEQNSFDIKFEGGGIKETDKSDFYKNFDELNFLVFSIEDITSFALADKLDLKN